MNKKYRHNKLEDNRGILLQISIIISLSIVLAAFNYKSKNKTEFSGDYIKINLDVDTNVSVKSKITKPLPLNIKNKILQQAQFPGGENALRNYFSDNLIYPEKAKEQDIQGRVYVKFTVNQYGKIKNLKVVRSIHPLLDNEAVRLIRNMPDWQPAKTQTGTFDSEHVLPVIFMKKTFNF